MPKIEQGRIVPETGAKYYVPAKKDAASLSIPSTTDVDLPASTSTQISTQESVLVGRTGRTGERGPIGETGSIGLQGTPGEVRNIVYGPNEPSDLESIWIDTSDETTSWEDETLLTAITDQVSQFAEKVDALKNVFNTAIDPGYFQDINPGTIDTKLGSVAHVLIKRGYKDKLTKDITRYTVTAAVMTTPGTGYTVGDEVILFPGITITVDTIAGGAATGPIATFTPTLPQEFTVPAQTNPVTVTGGTGSGASFTLTYLSVIVTVPVLLEGELGFCINDNSRELYIGYGGTLYLLAKSGGGSGGGSGTLTGAYVELVTTNGSKYRITMNDDGQLVIINSLADTVLSPPPGAASLYAGLIISKVYGGGATESNATPVSHSFVELYNQSYPQVTINLKGLAIQWGKLEQGTPLSWQIAPLRGELKPNCSFLIRGAMHSDPYKATTRIKILDYDMSVPDMAISAAGFKVYLNIPADITKPTTNINPAKIDPNLVIKEAGYINLVAAGGDNNQQIDAYEMKSSDPVPGTFAYLVNKNKMIKRKSNHDIGSFYSAKPTNVFAVYGNSFEDLEAIDMLTAAIDIYTPRSSRFGQWRWFWDQMPFDREVPSNLTISFGKDGDHDRIFTWHSPADIDQNYLLYRKSTDANWIRVRATSTVVALTDSVVNVNMAAMRNLIPGTYIYKVGSESRWTDEYPLEVRAVTNSDTINLLQVTDQQAWAGYEYTAWEKANACIEANETYDFIFNTGDITQNASRPFEWRYYSYYAKNNFCTHVHQMIVGNNDLIATDATKTITTVATFTGLITTNVSTNVTTLTVTAITTGNGKLVKDVGIVGAGVAPATVIVSQTAGTPVGGNGTYILNIAQTVTPAVVGMTAITVADVAGTKGDPSAFTYYLTMDAFYKLPPVTTTVGSTTITLANANKIVGIGDNIVGPGIPASTIAQTISGNTITMNNAATAAGSVILTLTPPSSKIFPSVYSFNYGFCHFIGLNSNIIPGFPGENTPEQIDFIRKDMALPENQKRWVIVCMHEAPYTLSSSAKLRAFINVFDEVGVDLVLCGHHHCYARSNKMGPIPTLLHFDTSISSTSDCSYKVWTASGGASVAAVATSRVYATFNATIAGATMIVLTMTSGKLAGPIAVVAQPAGRAGAVATPGHTILGVDGTIVPTGLTVTTIASGGLTGTYTLNKTLLINEAITVSSPMKAVLPCLVLDGINDFITTPANGDFAFGIHDFMIDCWIYAAQFKANATIVGNGVTTPGPTTRAIMLDATGHVVFGPLTSSAIVVDPTTPAWHHVAVSRRLGIVRMYIDGVFQSSVAMAGDVDFSLNGTFIGKNGWDAASFFVGNIDEFHATKKVAKWTTSTNFTPPVVYGAGIDDNDTVIGASLTGFVTGNILTVKTIDPGCVIKPGAVLTGGTLAAGTSIVAQQTFETTGVAGGNGTYTITPSATAPVFDNLNPGAFVTDQHIPGGYHFLSQATGYKLIGKTNPDTTAPWRADYDERVDALGPMYAMYEISYNQIAIKPYRLKQLTPLPINVGKDVYRELYQPFNIIKPAI